MLFVCGEDKIRFFQRKKRIDTTSINFNIFDKKNNLPLFLKEMIENSKFFVCVKHIQTT